MKGQKVQPLKTCSRFLRQNPWDSQMATLAYCRLRDRKHNLNVWLCDLWCVWGYLESIKISIAAVFFSPGGTGENTCQSHIWSQNCLRENNFFPLLLSKNSMREKKILALCPAEIHLSTENIALMSSPVMFILKMSNKNMQGSLSFSLSLSLSPSLHPSLS